ncbi:hypothetical protein ACULLL_01645 [Lysinibacillus irui]|uniref:hypothetical protein n=1 Tax=Lysinibacillus irui TaxID=2998077 RepID=UPI00404423F4
MKYRIGFINNLGRYHQIIINDVDSIDVKEGAYLFYNKQGILLYSIKVELVYAIGNVELLDIQDE